MRETTALARVASDAAEAIAASQEAPGGVTTLIIPADFQSAEAPGPAQPIPPVPPRPVDTHRIEHVAKQLRKEKNATLQLGGRALTERGQRAAGRVAKATGCRMFSERFPARFERGPGLPTVDRLPYSSTAVHQGCRIGPSASWSAWTGSWRSSAEAQTRGISV